MPEQQARGGLRPDEEAVRQTISRELDVDVERYDDGTRQRMYDLRVGPADNPTIVIEVTAARDTMSSWIENTATAPVPLESGVGLWLVELRNRPPPRDVAAAAREVIGLARDADVTEWDAGQPPVGFAIAPEIARKRAVLNERIDALGIARLSDITSWCNRMKEAGIPDIDIPAEDEARVLEEIAPDDTDIMSADEFVRWIEEFVEAHDDLRRKTGGDDAHERHLYIHVRSHPGSARAAALLGIGLIDRIVDTDHATIGPNSHRVSPYTHVWVAYNGGGHCVRWDGQQWRRFTPITEQA